MDNFVRIKPESVSALEGKTFVFLGSSVTVGASAGGRSMAEYIAARHNCDVIKWAVSGTTLSVCETGKSYVERLLSHIQNQPICDHLIVQLSTNDASRKRELGEMSLSKNPTDFDTSTVIGAIEFIIATAKEKWNCHVSFYTGTKYDSTAYKDMVNALLKIKEKWGIGVLDLYNDPEMNAVSKSDYELYMADPIHPTKSGYEDWWGPKFEEYLEQYK